MFHRPKAKALGYFVSPLRGLSSTHQTLWDGVDLLTFYLFLPFSEGYFCVAPSGLFGKEKAACRETGRSFKKDLTRTFHYDNLQSLGYGSPHLPLLWSGPQPSVQPLHPCLRARALNWDTRRIWS